MPLAADPNYDLHSAVYAFAPGVLCTDAIEAALAAQYVANGYTKLTQAQVLAITGAAPSYPTGLPRFSDSNPDPVDGWSLDAGKSGTT